MKCEQSVIEKREESVRVATMLFGKTLKILEQLDTLEVASIHAREIAYIDKWRLHLKRSIP